MKNIVALVSLVFASYALAGPQCAEQKTDQWLSEDEMITKLTDMGFTYDKFKISRGNCYEIYGHNRDGQKVEVYFDPISGDIVELETQS